MHGNSHITCTECGGLADHKEEFEYDVRLVECSQCGQEGNVTMSTHPLAKTKILSGNFAQLTTEGVQKLRSNL